MKKLFLTSAILATMVCPTFADNITTTNNDCDNTTLTTYSGSATLEADWSPNTVNVTYYNGDNVYGNGGQCTYDSTLTLPSHPSRTGYTFAGWTVRGGLCTDPSCLDWAKQGANEYYYRFRYNYKDYDNCEINSPDFEYSRVYNCSNSDFSDISLNEWKTVFDYGTVKGTSTCAANGVNGSNAYTQGTPDGSGKYCWCKVTEFNGIEQSLSWVAKSAYDNLSGCQVSCAKDCANSMRGSTLARSAMYGATIQRNVDCMTISDKNTCLASSYSDITGCRWINSACYGSKVNNCSTVNNQEACDTLEQTDGTMCKWINSSCQAVTSCESLTNKNICNTSWADGACGWWNSSCHKITTCDSILDEELCNDSEVSDEDGIACMWSGSSCRAVEWCSDITDEDKCQGANSMEEECYWWDGYCGGPYDD